MFRNWAGEEICKFFGWQFYKKLFAKILYSLRLFQMIYELYSSDSSEKVPRLLSEKQAKHFCSRVLCAKKLYLTVLFAVNVRVPQESSEWNANPSRRFSKEPI